MRYFEVEGDTPESILVAFSNERKIAKEFLTFTVLEQGSRGVLGIGKKSSKIRIEYNEKEFVKKRGRLYLSEILDGAGFNNYTIVVNSVDNKIIFDIDSDVPELLIGKHAQTLDALQYLLEKMLRLDGDREVEVSVDINKYREKMVVQLIEKAKSLAEEVLKTGRSLKMPALSSTMRKEVHIALKEIEGVSTISLGDGAIKQISIIPDKKRR